MQPVTRENVVTIIQIFWRKQNRRSVNIWISLNFKTPALIPLCIGWDWSKGYLAFKKQVFWMSRMNFFCIALVQWRSVFLFLNFWYLINLGLFFYVISILIKKGINTLIEKELTRRKKSNQKTYWERVWQRADMLDRQPSHPLQLPWGRFPQHAELFGHLLKQVHTWKTCSFLHGCLSYFYFLKPSSSILPIFSSSVH